MAQLQNQGKILEQTKDESKKKPQQVALTSVLKNIRGCLDEFKNLIGDADEINKLKKQNADLQKELYEKDFTANKKILEVRKEMGNVITELKVKNENDARIEAAHLDEIKQSNVNLKERVTQYESKLNLLNAKYEVIAFPLIN